MCHCSVKAQSTPIAIIANEGAQEAQSRKIRTSPQGLFPSLLFPKGHQQCAERIDATLNY